MKKLAIWLLLMIPLGIYAQQMNIVTFNIRFNNPGDGINAWPNRVEMVTGLLRFHEADIFGMQEALIGQIEDIQNQLPEFEWFGVGRDNGEQSGEFSPIFFRKSKFILIEHGTFWLSKTPDKPSKGWDAALNRIVTWGKFQSKETGKRFFVFNTHFDHIGVEARKNSAQLIHNKIDELTAQSHLPVILTGDFNLTPDTEPISLIKKYLSDSREVTKEPPYGPVGTFNGFTPGAEEENRIDYIFVNSDVKVLKYGVLSDSKDKRSPSDHLPVFARVQLK
ncbi:MAG TPA: endonuclease/exonuclease/phosphatase family protein [Draconibacterium sp.]|nr:endonuclease/exonuclease/phosphatase family protein [Draconibacterium sp.]